MLTVTAYSTAGPGEPFEKTTIERRELGPHDVLIKIAFAGICHSDIHTARGEWGAVIYPLVPGHEIAGTVEGIGTDVTRHGVGDRVGVGCMVDSCRECKHCLAGEEQHCVHGSVDTYNYIGKDGRPTEGGYSTHVVVDEAFTLRIPDSIPLSSAAPLLCAGITVYSPLRHWGAGPGTVLSQTLSKQKDAKRLGASHYYATSEQGTFEQLRGTFDLIINTVSGSQDMDAYLSLLSLDGTLVFVGAPPEALSLMVSSLQTNRRSFAGSSIGGIRETQEMLDFCAAHQIGSDVEVIRGDQIDEAWERVMSSDVRYRFVIDTATF